MRIGEKFCPGVMHAVAAKDGLLLRIRVPGGLISASQLEVAASLSVEFGDGNVEFTSRANLQLRAVREEYLLTIQSALASAGLFPSPQHDRIRNIVTSPLAGLYVEEFLDPQPLVRELDRRLQAEALFTELHPKFSFGLHGDHQRFSHELDDLSLEACKNGSLMRLAIAGVNTDCCVLTETAVDCLVEVSRRLIELGKSSEVPIRAKRIIAIPEAFNLLIGSLSSMLAPCSAAARLPDFVEVSQGVSPASRSGLVNIIPSIPLGRVSSQQASAIAEVVKRWDGDLRLAPWRGVVLGAMPVTAQKEIAEVLQSVGLSWDGQDGFHGIAACAGRSGCDASLADVRADASLLAQRLASKLAPARWTVNFSGCDKQCARRHGASAELIASDSGYLLKINGEDIKQNCSAEAAIEAVAKFHALRVSEVATV
jgi:precorrin-3B synthase